MNVQLGVEEARALFPRALDGELTLEEQEAFEAVLAAEPELDQEFAALRRVILATRGLSVNGPSVDLLSGVQAKLRTRSGGRFYRDRFAERQGRGALLTWVFFASVVIVLGTLFWLAVETGLLGS